MASLGTEFKTEEEIHKCYEDHRDSLRVAGLLTESASVDLFLAEKSAIEVFRSRPEQDYSQLP